MKHVFNFLFSLFAIYVAIHALVYAVGIVFGLGPAVWLLIFMVPVFLSNVTVLGALARGDAKQDATERKRRAWRGY